VDTDKPRYLFLFQLEIDLISQTPIYTLYIGLWMRLVGCVTCMVEIKKVYKMLLE